MALVVCPRCETSAVFAWHPPLQTGPLERPNAGEMHCPFCGLIGHRRDFLRPRLDSFGVVNTRAMGCWEAFDHYLSEEETTLIREIMEDR